MGFCSFICGIDELLGLTMALYHARACCSFKESSSRSTTTRATSQAAWRSDFHKEGNPPRTHSNGHESKARTPWPSEHPNPHKNTLKWVVHLPQNGTMVLTNGNSWCSPCNKVKALLGNTGALSRMRPWEKLGSGLQSLCLGLGDPHGTLECRRLATGSVGSRSVRKLSGRHCVLYQHTRRPLYGCVLPRHEVRHGQR